MKHLLPLLLLASPALAGSYQLPAGCSGVATVQAKDCTISHFYRCEGDQPGNLHRVDMDAQGPIFYSLIDSETRWLQSYSAFDQLEERMGEETDPASLSALLETGRDDYDFKTVDSEGTTTRYYGYDALTGKTMTVDGILFDQTEFEMTVEDANGKETWSVKGREYVQRDWRSFLSGLRTVTVDGETTITDGSPAAVALPGQPGHLSNRPLFGCDAVMSSLNL